MLQRKLAEIELLEKKYGKIEHEPNLEWIIFEEFKLPKGWNRGTTEILIMIPPGYPVTPPDNFYVPVGFRLESGAMPQSYSENQNHLGRQWGVFSVHIQKETWSPSTDILSGDNLLTYMMVVVEKRLEEAN